jgi:subtilisin family serine protease
VIHRWQEVEKMTLQPSLSPFVLTLLVGCVFFLLILLVILLLLLLYFYLRRRREGGKPLPPPKIVYPPDEFYIRNQVILSGPAGVINGLPDQVLRAHQVILRELDRLRFEELGEEWRNNCAHLPADLVIVKYQIEGDQPDVLRAIRLIDNVLGDQAGVVVKEPNWVTGQPYEIEGSPYEIEGSPYEIEGSGVDNPRIDVDSSLFLKQWAFEIIDLPATLQPPGEKAKIAGRNVVVGIFDSSPYPVLDASLNHYLTESANLDDAPSPMNLELCNVDSNPGIAGASKCPGGDTPEERKKNSMRNHGFFVAGLIHAISPESKLYLYRVLDNCNQGDLFLLMKGVFMFLRDVVSKRSPETYGTVINMSLVVRVPPSEAGFGLTTDLLSLNYVMEAANCLGTVAVSAAGNSSGNAIIPLPPSLPGGMSGTLAVAASNSENNRACFSNCGEVGAPGGDGRSSTDPADKDCKPRVAECTKGVECKVAVIGPAIRPPFTNPNNIYYVYWSGSSFSAPLASGLAALVLEAGDGRYSPDQVKKFIKCGAVTRDDYALGAGIINIPRTLELCARAAAE